MKQWVSCCWKTIGINGWKSLKKIMKAEVLVETSKNVKEQSKTKYTTQGKKKGNRGSGWFDEGKLRKTMSSLLW
jgi:hypothetical protein